MSKRNARPLDVIAGDIHRLERAPIFEIGALLIEANRSCEHGQWLDWLEAEFAWSRDTATRYMASAKLAAKFRTVRNLNVPSKVIYELAAKPDDPAMAAIIDALAKATKNKPITTCAKAAAVIDRARARIRFGDYPDATLDALQNIDGKGERPWAAQAIESLKAAKPTSEDAAEKIVDDIYRAHVIALYEPYGKLPDIPASSLWRLDDDVLVDRRASVLERLSAAPGPLTDEQIESIIWCRDHGDDNEADNDEDETDEDDSSEEDTDDDPSVVPSADPPGRSPSTLDPELLDALNVVVHYARRHPPTEVSGISGAELSEAIRFMEALHALVRGGDKAKLIADRAEATQRQRQASGAS